MKTVIFGATGNIGTQLVEQALAKGHTVTAFARNPQKLGITNKNLEIVAGDVHNLRQVEEAIRGQDSVICALGDGRKGEIRASGTKTIIEAMKETDVRRLICQSSLGVGESAGNLNFFWKYIMFGMLLRAAFADHVEQEKHVRESGLDWTIVRPAAFTDGELTGKYRHGFGPDVKDLTLKISKADVADFILRQLESEEYLSMSPGLSY